MSMANVNWRICEAVDTAETTDGDPLSEDEWDTIAIRKGYLSKHAFIVIPYERGGLTSTAMLRVNTPCTTRELITAVHDYYAEPITSVDEYDDSWDLRADAIQRLSEGKVVKRADLIGSLFFEGVRQLYGDIYLLLTGS